MSLELDDMEVLGSEVRGGVLYVEVRSTLPLACFYCGSMAVVGHGAAEPAGAGSAVCLSDRAVLGPAASEVPGLWADQPGASPGRGRL